MEDIFLPRTGDRPLAFRGELMAEADGARVGTKEQTRWHDLRVFVTESGQFVLAVTYHTRWDGEEGDEVVWVCQTAQEVVQRLAEYDPLSRVRGWPPGQQFEARQRALLADLTHRYETLVSRLLSQCPDTFAEKVG